MFDASKAFDRVKYCKLFNELLNCNVSPLILRLLSVLYTNQTLQVKWKSITGAGFSVLNGVKQGRVLSHVLFAVYIDGLLNRLSKSGMGCYMGNKFMGAVLFADDIKLLTPMFKGLKKLVSICEKYAEEYNIKFNGTKSKYMVYKGRNSMVHHEMFM